MQSILNKLNKLDELKLWPKFKREGKETHLLASTETWLSELDWDKEPLVSGFGSPFQLDWLPTSNVEGGGSTSARGTLTHWQSHSTLLFALQIPAGIFHHCLHTSVSQCIRSCTADCWLLVSICPDASKSILSDFNHCFSKTLRTYEQYVTCICHHTKELESNRPLLQFSEQGLQISGHDFLSQ